MADKLKLIHGMQFTGGNITELVAVFGDIFSFHNKDKAILRTEIGGLCSPLYISAGTWLVRGEDDRIRAYDNEAYQNMLHPIKEGKKEVQ